MIWTLFRKEEHVEDMDFPRKGRTGRRHEHSSDKGGAGSVAAAKDQVDQSTAAKDQVDRSTATNDQVDRSAAALDQEDRSAAAKDQKIEVLLQRIKRSKRCYEGSKGRSIAAKGSSDRVMQKMKTLKSSCSSY